MTTLQAVILAIVEGLTEYLPISSTGQMIVVSSLMGIAADQFTKDFTVIVQFGAILAVLFLYWRRFIESKHLYLKLFIAFLPTALIGFLVKSKIDILLESVIVVATTQILGGILLLFVDKWFERHERRLAELKAGHIDALDFKRSSLIGLVQCLAFIPGMSRSASTIIGGLFAGLNRQSAAEFSFLLAVPTLAAATAWKSIKIYDSIQPDQIGILLLGNLVAFVVAVITIKLFVGFLTRRGFFIFGVYRILLGLSIFVLLLSGNRLELL